jgi:hypothetical protein
MINWISFFLGMLVWAAISPLIIRLYKWIGWMICMRKIMKRLEGESMEEAMKKIGEWRND